MNKIFFSASRPSWAREKHIGIIIYILLLVAICTGSWTSSHELGVNPGSHEPLGQPDPPKFMNFGSHGSWAVHGQPYPRLSNELRERIIVWYYYQERSFEDIIELSGCSKNTIYRVLSNFEKFGQATNPHCRPAGRKRTLLSTDLMYIQGLLSAPLWTTWCR